MASQLAHSWYKSSYGDAEGSAWVEVAGSPSRVHLRDSKCPTRPHLIFRSAAFTVFLDGIR
ncbi:DUF397 domain-containing protein [Streptomyces acidicola]|uniref:DUF397 domain-containing protein n=1 Tax=Streptomyces acidicola TaxID=2596892 RepID=UPI0037F544D6